jgi:hemoglobin
VERPSIYEALGGGEPLLTLTAAHHRRCLEDPVLNHPFSHPDIDPRHVEKLAEYWGEVLGGPPTYLTSYGGHSAMLTLHASPGGDVDADLGDRFLACFVRAMDDVELPADPELRSALRSYMEWATADVMSHAPEGSAVAADLPMPRWGWDGLK